MGDITQNLLDTISIMTKHAVSNANFDRTIQAVIMSCEDQALGIYKVKYQDSIWKAYSNNLSTKYSAGTSVYILVPGNDMSRNKTIIGTVNTLGENYINYISNEQNYIENGNSIVKVLNEHQYGLCSYKGTDNIILYNSGASPEEDTFFKIDKIAQQQYLKTSEYIILKADFRTNLSQQQRRGGNYGLQVIVECFNSNNEEEIIDEHYVLDIDNMVGNPYTYAIPLTQKVYFPINSATIKKIKSIKFFSQSFQQDEEILTEDIFISNIEILGANTLTSQERQGTVLHFRLPKGYIFTEDDLDEPPATRTVIAQIRVLNKLLSSTEKVEYYWFKQDATINAGSIYYSKYGGKGWKCLNQYNSTSDIKFLSDTNIFTIAKSQVPSERTKFKCVAIYNGTELSNTFQIINVDSQYTIEITCNQQPVFYPNVNTLSLVCIVKNRKTNVQLSQGNTYNWRYITEYNDYNTLNNSTNILQIQSSMVRNYSDFYCSIYRAGDLIGTAAIRVTKNSVPQNRYVLSIVNGTQVFNYDEMGNSPYDLQNDNHLTIPQLSFTVIDVVTGLDVTNQVKEIIWTIPLKNTLLIDQNQVQIQDEEDADYREYTNLTNNFVYRISNRYDATKKNNDIKVKIFIHGIQLQGQTNFTFIKEGEPGTNGTGIVCRIVAKYRGQRVSGWLVAAVLNNRYQFNWDDLYLQLWQDGEIIYSGRYIEENLENENNLVQKIEWSILGNKDTSWFGIREQEDLTLPRSYVVKMIRPLSQNDINFNSSYGYNAGIIKATIQYNNRNYYALQPIVTIYTGTESIHDYLGNLDRTSGFKYVTYSQDGENPLYDSENSFKIILKNMSDIENITWMTRASKRISNNVFEEVSSNLKIDTYKSANLEKIQRFIKPTPIYDGISTTNCIIVKGTGFWIHIPVVLMYNRYGHKQLNDWDGVSINIDNDNNYILAPQIGAGIKNDTDNTFTGLLMGRVHNYNVNEDKIGLLGYKDGVRTIFLDSETGRAEFGIEGAGQIIIDPSSINHAIIKGGNYSTTAKTGMQIDLTNPQIKFGNENFVVNEDSLSLGQGKLIYNASQDTLTLNVNSIAIGGVDTKTRLDDVERIATNYLFVKTTSTSDSPAGLYMSQNKLTDSNIDNRSGGNIRLANTGLHIYRGKEQLASYGDTTYFYSWSGTGASRQQSTAATLGGSGLTIQKGIINLGTLNNTFNVPTSGSGLYIDSSGKLFLGKKENYIQWNGSTLTLQGNYNQTGGYISLGTLSSNAGAVPSSSTTGAGFKVSSSGAFTAGNNSNYICWTGSSLKMRADSFLTQDSQNNAIKFDNAKMYLTDTGVQIGQIGTSNWDGDTNYRGLVFQLKPTTRGGYMAWSAKNSGQDNEYKVKLMYTDTLFRTGSGVQYPANSLNISCNLYMHQYGIYNTELYNTNPRTTIYDNVTYSTFTGTCRTDYARELVFKNGLCVARNDL